MYPPYRAACCEAGMVNIMVIPMQDNASEKVPAMVLLVYFAMTRATKLPATAAAPGAIVNSVLCSAVKPKAEIIDGPIAR